MNDSEIDIEPNGDGISIHLPDRKLGKLKNAGWIIVCMAAMGTLFMFGWIATPVLWGVDLIRQGQVFGWIFVAFASLGLGGLYAAAKFLMLGISVLGDKTHCSITIGSDKIVSREKFGWFSFKREIVRDDVAELFVMPLKTVGGSRQETSDNQSAMRFAETFFGGDTANFYAISNRKRDGKMIAPGYSREVLDSVAAAMAEQLNRHSTEPVLIVRDPIGVGENEVAAGGHVTVQSLSEEDVAGADFELPDDSELEVIEKGGSTVYRIPERTVVKGNSGLFLFTVLWNGFMLIFTAAFFFGGGMNWFAAAFIAVFWLIGIGFLVGTIYLARQSALIGVKDGLLFIERKTIFGTKWMEFTADEVESIEMGSAGLTVNDVPVMNLQIKASDRKKPIGMFGHLDNAEIQWLAQQLRRSLSLID